MAWKVNMEPVIAIGGGRALLLQVLHPLVAAGVDQHSNFVEDPFSRGFRTADMMLKLAFGDPDVSERQASVFRRMHERIKGVSADGEQYDAMDPALLLWVWATLVDVSLLVYECAVTPLSELERERYYEAQKLVAYACGIPKGACPATLAGFRSYMDDVIKNDLRVTRVARLVAHAGRHPPLPQPLGWIAGRLGTFFTAALLPDRFRADLGYTWSRSADRVLAFVFFVSRVLARATPRTLRHLQNRYLIRRRRPLGWWKNRPVAVPEALREP
jgi:uncharacterized protein (DUF2236 family)